jgi:hypothetical protein
LAEKRAASEGETAPERRTQGGVGAYTYVDGDALTELIFEVRSQFMRDLSEESGDRWRPDSLHLVAIDVLEGKTTDEQLAVLRDLIDLNPSLMVARDSRGIFAHSDTPAAYIADLVCEVVCQVLSRDRMLHAEDKRRRRRMAARHAPGLDESYPGEP